MASKKKKEVVAEATPVEKEVVIEVTNEGVKEAPKVEVVFERSKSMPERFIDTIICHCDDSDNENYDEIEEVREDHINNRGFSDIGYHFYIEADGSIEAGRSLNTVGAHAKGHNANSIGICVHGDKYFTASSLQSLENKIRELILAIPTITKVIGHNEVDKTKTCPNYHMKRFKSILNEF
jgi:N-acetyl-anhydromuramyl-L-alanine amidase AmpD